MADNAIVLHDNQENEQRNDQPEESLGKKIVGWLKKIKTWFTEIPGHNIAFFLIGGGLCFQIARESGVITFHDSIQYFTSNMNSLKSGNVTGLLLSVFNHFRWDSFIFSSLGLFLTCK